MDNRNLIPTFLLLFLLVTKGSGLNFRKVKGHVADDLKSTKWRRHIEAYSPLHSHISLNIQITYHNNVPSNLILFGQPRDCEEILKRNAHTRGRDGVYTIYPVKKNPTRVYCDMTTDGGGWTVIQRRFNGHTNFQRNWNDCKKGFGGVNKEYWLGNDNIHTLTDGRNQELRIDMEKFTGTMVYARYSHFSVGSESSKYKLSISGYSGNAGDMMIKAHNLNGMPFTTKDRDNDLAGGNCATFHAGVWWYNHCTWSNLNGVYQSSKNGHRQTLFWGKQHESMKSTKMMIRNKK